MPAVDEIDAFVSKFDGAPTLSEFVGGVWGGQVPSGTPMPYAVVDELSPPDSKFCFGPQTAMEYCRLQVRVFAADKDQAWAMMSAVTAVYDFAALATNPRTVLQCVRIRKPFTIQLEDDEAGNAVWSSIVIYELLVQS